MLQYTACPVCDANSFSTLFAVKDYTVSQEQFGICICNNCTHGFTQLVPTQEQIGPYYKAEAYISHTDSQKGLINKLYHIVRKRTLLSKAGLVLKHTKKATGSLLDIGCGTGAFLNTMQQKQWTIKGLEPDADTRERAKSRYGISPSPSHELYAEKNQSYDAVTMWHVLEHVHELKQYFGKLHEVLSANGKLFIAVPNYTSFDASYYGAFWAAYDVPRHLYHFSPKSMEQLAKQFGFNLIAKKQMWFDSVYVSMLSEKYKTGKSGIFKAAAVGFWSNIKALFNVDNCSSIIYIFEKA
jgi:2-polyprenyl-3-methyl-5-hydroxy-6-metoxy-1,4-benzoquinol methylase